LPDDKNCEKVESSGEDLYVCDGVLYRPTYKDGDLVYEIVSDDPGETPPAAETPEAVDVVGLSLTQPMTSGPAVRELQQVLLDSGYDPGGTDGVFGSGTKTALLWLQYDYELEQTGMVDRPTAELLGFLPPSEPPEGAEGSSVETDTESPAGAQDSEPDSDEPPASDGETPKTGD
jgi:peptidoglycan hydrolase-like protein with peptidoglycan-binding domain